MNACLLLVVNIGENLCANARESLTDAALRWKFDYLELRSQTREGYYPSYEKLFKLADLDYAHYGTVVCLDADTLVRSDAPSPARVFGVGIHMVLDTQADESPSVQAAVLKEVHIDKYWPIAEHDPQKRATYEEYMRAPRNTGFIVINQPAPVEVFEQAVALCPPPWSPMALNGHCEQALINYCTCNVPGAKWQADATWNRRYPPEGPMQDFVYHYTGWGYLAERNRILTFDWRS